MDSTSNEPTFFGDGLLFNQSDREESVRGLQDMRPSDEDDCVMTGWGIIRAHVEDELYDRYGNLRAAVGMGGVEDSEQEIKEEIQDSEFNGWVEAQDFETGVDEAARGGTTLNGDREVHENSNANEEVGGREHTEHSDSSQSEKDPTEHATNTMSPPPEPDTLFTTSEAAVDYCQTWARQHGYAVSRSKGSDKCGQIVLVCDRGGDSERRRHRLEEAREERRKQGKISRVMAQGTGKVGCEFKLSLWRQKSGGWKLVFTNPLHNDHEPSDEPVAHSHLRRLTLDQLNFVEQQTNAGGDSSC
ncbi:hypothetical protein BJ508DRAFT_336213 [Ascobolus immersus RN42]|uniref:FAR1 domain-containing protein n=1 Tax=Ascobolus immersus RN42 TaxID=1160509 RepID=A0A3N4HFT8_ASCIM|nr:hypothetical protein BJ508DRAFT_336213 [Ascobolus immersus RN42]